LVAVRRLGEHDVAGASVPSFPSGKGIEIARSVGGLPSAALWQIPGVNTIRDCSVIALLRSTSGAVDSAVSLRVPSPHAVSLTGYALQLNGTHLNILLHIGGGAALLNAIPFPVSLNENVWLRFDAINIAGGGVLLRGKAWTGAIDDEPAIFQVSFTHNTTPHANPGLVGVMVPAGAITVQCGYFRLRSLFNSLNETLRHSKPASYLPVAEIPAIPDVATVSLSPAEVSLGSDLGKRAQVSISFSDHPGTDFGELYDAGTHWAKFRGRQLFRRGQPLRIIRGSLGQNYLDMERRNYVLESFSGPSRDRTFSIVGQDVLKFADSDRAQVPKMSNGSLLAGISDVDLVAALSPAGVGAQYPASGIANIGGSEIVFFTRIGDTVNIVRGQFGTTPTTHGAQERFQLCVIVQAATPAAIIASLLGQFAGVANSFIPLSEWEAECAANLGLFYTRLLAEPTSVRQVLNELIEQAGLAVWVDEIANKIRLQVLKGIPTDAFEFNETNTIVGTIQSQEQPSKVATEVWTYYGTRNPLESLDEPNNYRSSLVTIATEQESLLGQSAIKKVFATWIPAFGITAAQRTNSIHISRFSAPPRRVTFAVMRGAVGVPEPKLADGYQIRWFGNQNEAGEPTTAPIQVTRINPTEDRIEVEAEEMIFRQNQVVNVVDRVITIDSPINNLFLPSIYQAIFPVPTPQDVSDGVNLAVVIATNVSVGSASTALVAFDVGGPANWPPGFPIQIQIAAGGRIQGRGGDGGGFPASGVPSAPTVGGLALRTRVPMSLVNSGFVWGGGGGGGTAASPGGPGIGGGGAGTFGGLAGPKFAIGIPAAQNGSPDAGGAGSTLGSSIGGAGGGPGLPGVAGSGITLSQPGAPAGPAVDGTAFVTYTVPGDIRGPLI
jgi:hypothetical protein